ncbi:DUF2970 domain-containing protein [Ramlibacter rhizophilus]
MASPRKGSILQTARAVAWAFLGVRKNSAYQQDLGRLNPLHVIVVALVAALLFVLALVGLVHWVVN